MLFQGSNDSGKGGSDVTTTVVEEEGADGQRVKRGSRRTSTSSRSSGSSEAGEHGHSTVAVRPHSAGVVAASSSGASSASVGSATPEQTTTQTSGANVQPCIFEFVIPQQLVGRLIGKHGCFVQQIKTETNCSIFVKRHPESVKHKVCAIEGNYKLGKHIFVLLNTVL